MRFVITGEWNRNRLLRLILLMFLFYTSFFWLTNALLYFQKMGLTFQSVVEYYRGSEARYLQPRTYQGLLEISHFHLFAMGILIMTLTHLALFVPMPIRVKFWSILSCFASAFLDEGSSWLVRFLNPWFAYVKIASFLVLEGSLGFLVIATCMALIGNAPKAYNDDARCSPPGNPV